MQQLEKLLLAQRQLKEEQDSMINTVTTGEGTTQSEAVGPAVSLPVKIGGVAVEAFVDTGSQSTIMSRSMLHLIVQSWRTLTSFGGADCEVVW